MAEEVALYRADWAIDTGTPDEQTLSPVCVSPRIAGTKLVFDIVQSIEAGRYRATRVPTWRGEPMKGWCDSREEDGDVEVQVNVEGETAKWHLLFALETFTELKRAVVALECSTQALQKKVDVRGFSIQKGRKVALGKIAVRSAAAPMAEESRSLAPPGKHTR